MVYVLRITYLQIFDLHWEISRFAVYIIDYIKVVTYNWLMQNYTFGALWLVVKSAVYKYAYLLFNYLRSQRSERSGEEDGTEGTMSLQKLRQTSERAADESTQSQTIFR